MTGYGLIRRSCRGFAVVTAVFILIALAVLAAAIVSIVRTQQTSSMFDVAGARAYHAARAGVEAGAYNSLRNDNCAPQTLAFGGALTGYETAVACTRTTHNEAGVNVNTDTIVATACNQAPCPAAAPGADYVERQLTIVVSQ